MKQNRPPAGWNEDRLRRVLAHYESQTEDEAVAEDEAAFRARAQTVMVVPKSLVPEITRLIERRRPGRSSSGSKNQQAAVQRARGSRR